jgi:hypothetical protein
MLPQYDVYHITQVTSNKLPVHRYQDVLKDADEHGRPENVQIKVTFMLFQRRCQLFILANFHQTYLHDGQVSPKVAELSQQ